MSFEIRRASSDEWETMRSIRLAALEDAPMAYSSTLAREQAFAEEAWRSRLDTSMAYLAWEGGRVVGTVTAYQDPAGPADTMFLVAMFVQAAVRGSECSRLLIDAVVEAARAAGAQQLLLHVTQTNAAARRRYQSYGFNATGRTQPLPHAPHVAEIEMALSLRTAAVRS